MILLVEDEAIVAASGKMLLKREGYDVIHVSSGEQAIAAVERAAGKIDLILMDIDLGYNSMNGTDAAAIILKNYDIPLLFLSSHTEKEIVSLTEKITSYGYVVKGSGETVLLASINMAFRLHSAHKRLELKDEALRKSETKYRHLFENMTSAFVLHEAVRDSSGGIVDFRISDANPASETLTGKTVKELIGKTINELNPGINPSWMEKFIKIINTGQPSAYLEYFPKYNKYLDTLLFCPGKDQVASIIADVSDRIRAEKEIQISNRLYAFISQINEMIVRTRDKDLLFSGVCRIAVESGKFLMAWLGLVDEKEQVVKPVAWAGYEEGYLSKIKTIPVSDVPEGRGPSGTAIREGKYYLCNDIENDPAMNIWRQEALSRGYYASISLPLIVFGRVIGVFSLYSSEPMTFSEREIALLQEVTGDISYALEIIENDKKLHSAENNRKKSELRYKMLIEQASDGIFVSDKTGRYLDVNTAGCNMLGYSRTEILQRNLSDFLLKEDLQQKPVNYDDLLAGKTIKSVRRMIRKDGSAVPVEITGRMIEGEQILGFVRDITERVEAEEELKKSQFLLKSVIEGSTDAIYVKDLTGRYIMCNNATARIMGKTKQEIIGRDDHFLFPEKGTEEIISLDNEIMFSRQIRTIDETVMMKNGSVRYFLTIKGPVMDENGKVHGLFGIAKDITDRKLNEIRMTKNAEEMQALNTAKDKLLSVVAHDLRGPFMGFVGLTEDLANHISELSEEEITEYAHVMNSTARKINELLSNLLEWSRLQTGKIEFDPVEVDLNEIAGNIISLFASAAAGKSITIMNNINAGTRVSADKNMTSAIIRNLISNAIKFTGTGGKITLSSEPAGGFIRVAVSDTGTGMSEMTMKKIFRTDTIFTSKGTQQEEGSGFGLVLCREMVDKNGGSMTVESAPGKGSTFYFTLPSRA
ncbi:MAG: PAS domain S-box protein [Syntrophothermus sp.]